HIAHAYADDPQRAATVVRQQIAATPGVRAVGEIGLDFHYHHSAREVQQQVFRAQVALARELPLPVVIHTREADADTMRILREEGGTGLKAVLHCCTATPARARSALECGLFISVAGIITFPGAGDLRETVRALPP